MSQADSSNAGAADAPNAGSTAAPSPSATTSPGSPSDGPNVVYERPPPGLARGTWSAPAWVVVLLGVALVGAIVAFFVIRHRRDKAPDSTLGPPSVPPSSRR